VALLAAAATAGVMALVAVIPADDSAEASSPVPVAAPAAVPAVLQDGTGPGTTVTVEGDERKDRRNLQAGLTIEGGNVYFWGWGKCGALGYKTTCSAFATPDNLAPTKVYGLPEGAIVEATGGIYNFNAVDKSGYVWGWGSYSNRDGTGSRVGTGASYPPKRLRIGASWDDRCFNASGSIVSNCGKPFLGEGDPVKLLSGTEMSGAAVTESGVVYSWGGMNYGGVGKGDIAGSLTDGQNVWGAQMVTGLPPLSIEGNKPVQIEGGYQTYWIMLENGDVYYFGGNPSSVLGSPFERALGDHERQYSGRPTITSYVSGYPQGQGQIAVKSVALAPWFRATNPDEYVTLVHSGIGFGAALLSTGKVLTWGRNDGDMENGSVNDWGALGRRCASGTTGSASAKAAVRDNCYRSPGYVSWAGTAPRIVQIACSFTAVTALAQDGTLYGWGAPVRSYEGYPSKIEGGGRGKELFEYASSYAAPDVGAIIVVDRNVVKFQVGQGFVIWWDNNGKQWGRGWHENGSLGHHAGNWGRPGFYNETRKRWIWFSKPQYEGCHYTDQAKGYGSWNSDAEIYFKHNSNTYNKVKYYCDDLDKKVDGAWVNRLTFEECLAGKCLGPNGEGYSDPVCDASDPANDCGEEGTPTDPPKPGVCEPDEDGVVDPECTASPGDT
jgi:alpha-tubulin suppressor-like RCC1 family protein